jgi:trehalose synthase
MGDLVEFIRAARDRGMRVIADFVVNHTSDQHPWFIEARKSRDNPYRDFYVWRSDTPPDTSSQVVFPGEETSLWTQDDATGEWYLHMFAKHQPDLNVTNPGVRNEIAKAMGLWLELGLDGFRLDAVPFFLETRGQPKDEAANLDPHGYLTALRSFVSRRNGSAVLLGEVNLPYKEQLEYFGGPDGNELNMQFDFMTMQHLYLSLARQDARPLAETLKGRPPLHPDNQWAMFVRNHDELTLDKLSEGERGEVFAAFGPEKNMQIYGRGLRRRLPPMLGGDPERLRLVYSLMFSLPGTPVLFYGEEIGMGEDLRQKSRAAVRTPMQWSDAKNGGFSSAKAADLIVPLVRGEYGPENVNAAAAKRDPNSLFNFMATLISRYRESPELGWGAFAIIDQPEPAVFAHTSSSDGGTLVLLHNLGEEPVKVAGRVGPEDGPRQAFKGAILLDLFDGDNVALEPDGGFTVELGRYGYRWFRVHGKGDRLAP